LRASATPNGLTAEEQYIESKRYPEWPNGGKGEEEERRKRLVAQ